MANLSFIRASTLANLLATADSEGKMFVRVLTPSRLALGADPLMPVAIIDLAQEKLLPYNSAESAEPLNDRVDAGTARHDDGPRYRVSRRGGQYWFELNGEKVEAHSLRDLLADGLRAFEAERPGTLEKLSQIKARSRRIVARDPKLLFDKGHLAEEYAEKLSDGWFYGTNNSAETTNSWLRQACSIAGFTWGKDFKTNLGPTLDDLA